MGTIVTTSSMTNTLSTQFHHKSRDRGCHPDSLACPSTYAQNNSGVVCKASCYVLFKKCVLSQMCVCFQVKLVEDGGCILKKQNWFSYGKYGTQGTALIYPLGCGQLDLVGGPT